MKRFAIVLRMENYIGLVTKIAVKYWRALPASAKAWITPDDFINEGMTYGRFKVVPYYDVMAGSFTTILTIALNQFYEKKLRYIKRQRRDRGEEVRLEDIEGITKIPRNSADVSLSRISMQKLYLHASPELQRHLKVWFFNKKSPDRIRVSATFKRARKEFLKLAPKFSVGINDCRNLLEDRKKKSIS